MNLTVRINDVEYRDNCVQGVTFSEELSETLDSGSIRLTHIQGRLNIKPYDDVYIYDSSINYLQSAEALKTGGQLSNNPFYRHFLIDQFTENILNLGKGIYSYTIELFSETKRLEAIQLPNKSITQPLRVSKKISIYNYLLKFTKMFSPKIKVIDRTNQGRWKYVRKYSVDPSLQSVFDNIYSPDFTLSNPNFRDVLSQLMIVADRIPYVKDNVIYAKDISSRNRHFYMNTEQDEGRIGQISSSMSSDNYCDSVRRQYSNALAQNGLCNLTEYLGFRNKESSLMALANMRLETNNPIYKINKVYMCYYKNGKYTPDTTAASPSRLNYSFLCEQDITPLVKLSSEWNLLSQDWRDISSQSNYPKTIEELARYKVATVYYSQGSNFIDGWGTKYGEYETLPLEVVPITKTHIENIFNFMDGQYPYGIRSKEYILNAIDPVAYDEGISDFDISENTTTILGGLVTLSSSANIYMPADLIPQQTLRASEINYKGLFFRVEYTSFYNGALIHSRDLGIDDIVHNDNSSSSLTLLEKDGLNQKEKLNRFANKNYLFNGRYDSFDDVLELGDYTSINGETDIIIHKREYSIYNNEILVSYAAIKNFVLKNYFTSVYAKYRTYQLMSYGESVSRSENKKAIFLLSRTKNYKDEETFYTLPTKLLFGGFMSNLYRVSAGQIADSNSINFGYLTKGEITNNVIYQYLLDEHTFVSGKSLCFNAKMGDNISGGNHIVQYSSEYKLLKENPSNDAKYVVGAIQDWYNLADDSETGAIEKMGFYFGHIDETGLKAVRVESGANSAIDDFYKKVVAALPRFAYPTTGVTNMYKYGLRHNLFGNVEEIDKDNKELIDMTYQLEPISDSDDIVVGQWLVRLSDLFGGYKKINADFASNASRAIAYIDIDFKRSIGTGPFSANELWFSLDPDAVVSAISYRTISNNIFDVLSGYQWKVNVGGTSTYTFKSETGDIGITVYRLEVTGEDRITLYCDGYATEKYQTSGGEVEVDHFFSKLVFIKDATTGNLISKIQLQRTESFVTGADFALNIIDKPDLIKDHSTQTTFVFKKNMFLKYSTDKLDVDIEYKEYPSYYGGFDSALDVESVFKVLTDNNGQDYIEVNLNNMPSGTKSIQYWYFDDKDAYSKTLVKTNTDYKYDYAYDNVASTYHFVFGVNVDNLTTEEITNNKIKIYISELLNRDTRVFDEKGVLIGSIHNNIDTIYDYNAYDPIPGVTSTVNSYPLKMSPLSDEGIDKIYYKKEDDANFTEVSTETTVQIPFGTILYLYATTNDSSYIYKYNANNPLIIKMQDGGYTYEPSVFYGVAQPAAARWRTVWQGDAITNGYYKPHFSAVFETNSVSVSGLNTSVSAPNTRISGYMYYDAIQTCTFTNKVDGEYITRPSAALTINVFYISNITVVDANTLSIRGRGDAGAPSKSYLHITKIEQYY